MRWQLSFRGAARIVSSPLPISEGRCTPLIFSLLLKSLRKNPDKFESCAAVASGLGCERVKGVGSAPPALTNVDIRLLTLVDACALAAVVSGRRASRPLCPGGERHRGEGLTIQSGHFALAVEGLVSRKSGTSQGFPPFEFSECVRRADSLLEATIAAEALE